MSGRASQRSVRAITLVEIVIAGLILALGLLPVISTYMSSAREAKLNRNRAFAAMLANALIERYRSVPVPLLKGKFLSASEMETKVKAVVTNPQRVQATGARFAYEPAFIKDDALLFKMTSDEAQKLQARTPSPDLYSAEFKKMVKDRFHCFVAFETVSATDLGSGSPAFIPPDLPVMGRLLATVCWLETMAGGIVTGSDTPSPGNIAQRFTLGALVGTPYFPHGHK